MAVTAREARQHAIDRARERYGLNLSREDLDEIGMMVRCRAAEFVCRRQGRATEYLVDLRGVRLRVIYSRKLHTVTTVLPPRVDVGAERVAEERREANVAANERRKRMRQEEVDAILAVLADEYDGAVVDIQGYADVRLLEAAGLRYTVHRGRLARLVNEKRVKVTSGWPGYVLAVEACDN